MIDRNYFQQFTFLKKSALFIGCLFFTVFIFSCKNGNRPEPESTLSSDPKIANLKLPAGFHADHLYGPSENGEGSWVSMTFDDKGRLIASDQDGAMYRMQIPGIGDTITKIKIERLDIPAEARGAIDTSKKSVSIGYAHGLLWAFNSLYVMINHDNDDSAFKKENGLYRLQDTNGDDSFDKITLLKELKGEGEHGPHSIIMSPDKKSCNS